MLGTLLALVLAACLGWWLRKPSKPMPIPRPIRKPPADVAAVPSEELARLIAGRRRPGKVCDRCGGLGHVLDFAGGTTTAGNCPECGGCGRVAPVADADGAADGQR
jgi:hypothetical protein